MAELLTQAVFSFFTRVNIEDNGYNATNKYQLNASFTIGINQKYQSATRTRSASITLIIIRKALRRSKAYML